jgi:DNA-binding GntR family transcriptional regulator
MASANKSPHIPDISSVPSGPIFGKTKRERVYQSLKQAITTGVYPPGSYLPTARALADQYNVSITPIYQAIDSLQDDALVETLAGYGTRVLEPGKTAPSLRRPLIEMLTTLKQISDHPRFKHHLPAVQEQLIVRLRESPGLRVSLATLDAENHEKSMLHFIYECRHLRPNVLVFCEPEDFSEETYAELIQLQKSGTRIVYRASRKDCPEFDRVSSDFEQGQADLTRHLLQQGHHELLRVAIDPKPLFEQQKQRGFVAAMTAAGRSADQAAAASWELGSAFLSLKPMERVTHLIGLLTIELRKRPITAIMAPDDPMAAAFRIALDYLNRTDILVAGYDNIWEDVLDGVLADYGDELKDRRPLLTVDVQLPLVGDAMAELAVQGALGKAPPEPLLRTVPQLLVTTA